MTMRRGFWSLIAALTVVSTAGQCALAQTAAADKWEKSIAAFESRDKVDPPPQGALLFVGSSSIRGWDLGESFPDRNTINRGFGGSEIADSIRYADRIIIPYQPRVIVVYAGDNDIAHGKDVETVFADYQSLTRTIHASLPKARIVFVAIKPSIKRWELVEEMRKANGMIREATAKDARLEFVDVDTPMIGDDGQPRKDLFKADGLHLNKQGYQLWSKLVRPHLK
ncbi:MAG: SGNH/GDSL hydrolase family protein [Pirellulaceae bacterium]|jgi:lysophospholipase L1-like esterase|nr:SGNH/GDSL hydrolase family protein [Pirellulaceae bacterium]